MKQKSKRVDRSGRLQTMGLKTRRVKSGRHVRASIEEPGAWSPDAWGIPADDEPDEMHGSTVFPREGDKQASARRAVERYMEQRALEKALSDDLQ